MPPRQLEADRRDVCSRKSFADLKPQIKAPRLAAGWDDRSFLTERLLGALDVPPRHPRPPAAARSAPREDPATSTRSSGTTGRAAFERWPRAAAPAQRVDIGCAPLFCLDLAAARPRLNVLGLEIRAALAEAEADARAAGLGNAHFLACNANVNLDALLRRAAVLRARVGERPVPDPWFKARHRRRVVQLAAARSLAEHLAGRLALLRRCARRRGDARACATPPPSSSDARADADDWSAPSPTRSATSRRAASARCSPGRARRATRACAVFHRL